MPRKRWWSISPRAKKYLKTLRQIPADIRLAMATRDILPANGNHCVCGWALREAIAREVKRVPADEISVEGVYVHNPENQSLIRRAKPTIWGSASFRDPSHPRYDEGHSGRGCYAKFNGVSDYDWLRLYKGAVSDTAAVEEAFFFAFAEAAEGRELVKL